MASLSCPESAAKYPWQWSKLGLQRGKNRKCFTKWEFYIFSYATIIYAIFYFPLQG